MRNRFLTTSGDQLSDVASDFRSVVWRCRRQANQERWQVLLRELGVLMAIVACILWGALSGGYWSTVDSMINGLVYLLFLFAGAMLGLQIAFPCRIAADFLSGEERERWHQELHGQAMELLEALSIVDDPLLMIADETMRKLHVLR